MQGRVSEKSGYENIIKQDKKSFILMIYRALIS
jgi:hypothetical protein